VRENAGFQCDKAAVLGDKTKQRPVSHASQSCIYLFIFIAGAHFSALPQVQEILFAVRKKVRYFGVTARDT
jgi:hypothetical protein